MSIDSTSSVAYSCNSPGGSPDRMTRAGSLNFKKYMQEHEESNPSIIQVEQVLPVEEVLSEEEHDNMDNNMESADEDFEKSEEQKIESVRPDILAKLPSHIKQIYNW